MAGAIAVAGAATAALAEAAALPLLFSSFSPVDEARELLPSLERSLLCVLGIPSRQIKSQQLFLLSVCVKKKFVTC